MMTLGRAIAAYEASLLQGDGRFDRALYGGERSGADAARMAGL